MARNTPHISYHSEAIYYQGSTSLANSAGAVTGNGETGTSANLISGFLKHAAGNIYINYRAFLSFDLSNIPHSEVTSVVLKLKRNNTNTNDHDLYIVASEATDDVWVPDYRAGLTGEDGYPYTDDLIKYYDSAWTPGGTSIGDTTTVTLNATAVTDVQKQMSSGKFKLAIMNQYDFLNTYGVLAIGDALSVRGAIFYSTQDSTTSNHPVLEVTTNHTILEISADMTFNGGNHTIK